ncbi:hypothetical protein DL769_001924 [Monosporascus sp. CRB-8-3]|nr:hypothetical protein DL769_001924 [Monosporascus sp. CRB-8-3]
MLQTPCEHHWPEEIDILRPLEERFLAIGIAFGSITKFSLDPETNHPTSSAYRKITGHITVFSNDVYGVAKVLPRPLENVLGLRKTVMIKALSWLKVNNHLYRDVPINESFWDVWGDDEEILPPYLIDNITHMPDAEYEKAERSGYVPNEKSAPPTFNRETPSDSDISDTDDGNNINDVGYVRSTSEDIQPSDRVINSASNGGASTHNGHGSVRQDPLVPQASCSRYTMAANGEDGDRRSQQLAGSTAGAGQDSFQAEELCGLLLSYVNMAVMQELIPFSLSSNPQMSDLLREIAIFGRQQPLSNESKVNQRDKIKSMILRYGIPLIWFTINPNDLSSPIRIKFGERYRGSKYHERQLKRLELRITHTARKILKEVNQDPVSSVRWFHTHTQAFFDEIVRANSKDGAFGPVKHYFGAVETNGRGAFHLHGILWFEGNMNAENMLEDICAKDDPAELLRFLAWVDEHFQEDYDSIVSKQRSLDHSRLEPNSDLEKNVDRLEHEWEDEAQMVATAAQLHSCSHTCRKTHIDKDGVLRIRRTSRSCSRWNKVIAAALRHNHDFSLICTKTKTLALLHYVTNYATKLESPTYQRFALLAAHLDSIKKNPDFLNLEDPDAIATSLMIRISNKIFSERELSSIDVCNYLLGYDTYYCSETDWRWLHTNTIYWAVRRVWPHLQCLAANAPGSQQDSTDDFISLDPVSGMRPSIFQAYQQRGSEFRYLCLYDYAAMVEIVKKPRENRWTQRFQHIIPERLRYYNNNFNLLHKSREDAIKDAKLWGARADWDPMIDGDDEEDGEDEREDEHIQEVTDYENMMAFSTSILDTLNETTKRGIPIFESSVRQIFQVFQPSNLREAVGFPRAPELRHYWQLHSELEGDGTSLDIIESIELQVKEWRADLKHLNETALQRIAGELDDVQSLTNGTTSNHAENLRTSSRRRSPRLHTPLEDDDLIGMNEDPIQSRITTTMPQSSQRTYAPQPTTISIEYHSGTTWADLSAVLREAFHLNEKQSVALDIILRHMDEVDKVRAESEVDATSAGDNDAVTSGGPPQLLFYLGGEGGTGKSQVIKALSQAFERKGLRRKLRLTATSGSAGAGINGTTIHSAVDLGITRGNNGSYRKKMDQRLAQQWQETDVLVLEECSMMGGADFYRLHTRLREATGRYDSDFGGIPIVILCGDFFQFDPVMAYPMLYPGKPTTQKDYETTGVMFESGKHDLE